MHAKPNENASPGTVGAQGTIATGRLNELFKPSNPEPKELLSASAAAVTIAIPIEPTRELSNADWLDELGEVDPNDIPVCPTCGDLCDVELLSGDWRHSPCDPDSAERRIRTLRLLRHAQRIKKSL